MAKVKKARLRSALLQTQQAKAQRDARQRRIQHQEQQQQQQQGKKPAPSKHKRKPYFPYATHHTILLVGEGNFSFARSVAERLESGANMVATAYDSESVARDKYSDLEDHLSVFRDLGGTVLFGVDGTALDGCSLIRGRRFSHIVFNFPHVGAGIKDQDRNIISNQELLVGFFGSAQAFLDEGVPVESGVLHGSDDEGGGRMPAKRRRQRSRRPTTRTIEFEGVQAQVVYGVAEQPDHNAGVVPGQIHVTLKSGMPYDGWNIRRLAQQCGLASHSTRPFDIDAYPGYQHRRTLGFKDGVSKDENREIRTKNPKLHALIVCPPKEEDDNSDQGSAHRNSAHRNSAHRNSAPRSKRSAHAVGRTSEM